MTADRATRPRKYFVETFGCQMNVNDSEKAAGLLESDGYEPARTPSDADVVFVNTCAVREKAAEKLYHAVGRYRTLKRERPGLKIAVGGCVAQLQGAEVFARAPGIDVMIGTHNLSRLPELLRENEASGERRSDLDRRADAFEVPHERVSHSSAVRAYVTIMEGCNHVCSFCVVPRTRGTEVCRPVEQIVAEVASLLDRGYHEVMLLGQTVNAYEHGGVGFPELLERVHDLDERLWRLRFTTSHPEHVDTRMANAFARLPRLAPYMHLPVQSGSDRILSRMRRGYSAAEYLERLELLRAGRPDLALTADVIVGYPGETEEDFQRTVDVVEAARLEGLFVFLYSPRPGTTAIREPDDVSEAEKKRRFRVLNESQQRRQRATNEQLVGTIQEVLVETVDGDGEATGRTPQFRLVHFESEGTQVGERVRVKVAQGLPNSLIGTRVPEGR